MIRFLADNPLLILFVVMAVGAGVGALNIGGASLGPAIGGTEHGDEVLKTRKMDALQIIFNLLEQSPGQRFFPLTV